MSVAPAATPSVVLVRLPPSASVRVPSFTLVAPVYPLLPESVSNPALAFTRLPVELSAPLKVPLPRVNAVPSSVTVPPPSSVCSVTVLLNRFTIPSAVSTVVPESTEPISELSVAPAATPSVVLVRLPPRASVRVPSFTLVAPM